MKHIHITGNIQKNQILDSVETLIDSKQGEKKHVLKAILSRAKSFLSIKNKPDLKKPNKSKSPSLLSIDSFDVPVPQTNFERLNAIFNLYQQRQNLDVKINDKMCIDTINRLIKNESLNGIFANENGDRKDYRDIDDTCFMYELIWPPDGVVYDFE